MAPDHRTNFYDLTRAELTARLVAWGFSPVHAARLWNYLYWECVGSWEAMPELPTKVRTRLAAECVLTVLPVAQELHSRDGFTRKFLLGLADGRRIETVLMRFTGRATACVSSQVGCAMGCGFCATGQWGFQRHLSAGEIVAQAVHLQRLLRSESADSISEQRDPEPETRNSKLRGAAVPRLRNLVLMGMGEPLHNYDAVMQAVDILRDQNGFALAASRITLSTVGVVPGIRRLADEVRPVHLAVSLHAATQAERAALVPVAQKWPLDELMAACRYYCEKLQRRIFFEFALIAGKNDSAEQAHAGSISPPAAASWRGRKANRPKAECSRVREHAEVQRTAREGARLRVRPSVRREDVAACISMRRFRQTALRDRSFRRRRS
jgi:23S rRNA (adenine2503-C2)-methyltransferase